MKQNKITTVPGAIAASGKAINAATEHGEAIGLKNNTAAVITADKNGLVTADDNYKEGKISLALQRAALNAVLLTVIAFLTLVRDVFKQHLGSKPSPDWEGLGFIGSLTIPRTVDGCRYALQRVKLYLATHQTREVAQLSMTAARAQELLDELESADNAARAKKTTLANLKKARDSKFTAVRVRLANLFNELKAFLSPLDARWIQFGFKLPGAVETPPVPVNVIARLMGADAAVLQWTAAPRAEYYRIWKKVVGVDEELIPVGSPADLDFTLGALPGNATIELAVSAVNNGGESAKSEIITVTTT